MDDGSSSPAVIFVSEFSELSVALLKRFAKRGVSSFVVARDAEKWKKQLPGLGIFSYKESPPAGEYVVYIDDSFGKMVNDDRPTERLKRGTKYASEIASKFSCKLLFVFPFVQSEDDYKKRKDVYKKLLKENIFAGALFLGELISEDFFSNRKTAPFKDGVFYPLFLDDAAEEVVRATFSLGVFGKRTAVYANPIKVEEMAEIFGKLGTGTAPFRNEEVVLAEVDDSIVRKSDTKKRLSKILKEKVSPQVPSDRSDLSEKEDTHLPQLSPGGLIENKPSSHSNRLPTKRLTDWFSRKKQGLMSKRKSGRPRGHGVFKGLPGWRITNFSVAVRWGIISAIVLVFLAPTLFLLISFSSMFIAKHSFRAGNTQVARRGFDAAGTLANFSKNHSLQFSHFPVIGGFYKGLFDSSRLAIRLAETGTLAVSVSENLAVLHQSVFQERPYDLEAQKGRVVLGLDELYKSLGFLEGLLKNSNGLTKNASGLLVNENLIPSLRKEVWFTKIFLKELPELLGQNGTKTYLVLFQENTTPRPTGGVITAYALVEVSGGRLGEVSVHGSALSDNKLGGRVGAPAPLAEYFGLDSWSLHDSNWSPDFPTSAQRAEWFIEKELDEMVDGVIGVDEVFVKNFLSESGEEKDKSQLLEAFIGALSNQSESEFRKSLFLIIDALDERGLQVFVHHGSAQRAIGELGWDGSLQRKTACMDNCGDDFISVIEAHTNESVFEGVVKEALLEISVEEGVVKERLTLFIENTEKSGSYESYIRVFVPADAGFGLIREVGANKETNYQPQVYGSGGFKEAGVFVKVSSVDAKALVFSWERGEVLNFSKSGSYLFFWRKQAGVKSYPVEIKISFPNDLNIITDNPLALTRDNELLYNTELTKDTSIRVFW